MPYKDPAKARARDRQCYRCLTEEHIALGLCPKCGSAPPAPDHSLCQRCREKRRKAERARYAAGKAAGKLYGGRDAERCRRIARGRSRRRDQARRDAGLCTRCGRHPPVEGGTVCEPCREARRENEREQYAERRAAGQCGRCGAYGGFARTAGSHPGARRVVPPAPAALMCIRANIAAFRSGLRVTRSSRPRRARITEPGTAGRRSRCAWPSPGFPGNKSRSSPMFHPWRP